jgi:hypothetical protein
MSGDDVRHFDGQLGRRILSDMCDKFAEVAKYSDHTIGAMTVVLRARMQTGQI